MCLCACVRTLPFQTKEAIGELMRTAAFSVSKAAWAAGNFRAHVCDAVHSATTKVTLSNDNVAGVKLPVFNEVRSCLHHAHSLLARRALHAPCCTRQQLPDVAVAAGGHDRKQLSNPAESDSVVGLGLSGGGKHIKACQDNFSKLLAAIVKLASLQVSVAFDVASWLASSRSVRLSACVYTCVLVGHRLLSRPWMKPSSSPIAA